MGNAYSSDEVQRKKGEIRPFLVKVHSAALNPGNYFFVQPELFDRLREEICFNREATQYLWGQMKQNTDVNMQDIMIMKKTNWDSYLAHHLRTMEPRIRDVQRRLFAPDKADNYGLRSTRRSMWEVCVNPANGNGKYLSWNEFYCMCILIDWKCPHNVFSVSGALRLSLIFAIYDQGAKGFLDGQDLKRMLEDLQLVCDLDESGPSLPFKEGAAAAVKILEKNRLELEEFWELVASNSLRGTSQLYRVDLGIPYTPPVGVNPNQLAGAPVYPPSTSVFTARIPDDAPQPTGGGGGGSSPSSPPGQRTVNRSAAAGGGDPGGEPSVVRKSSIPKHAKDKAKDVPARPKAGTPAVPPSDHIFDLKQQEVPKRRSPTAAPPPPPPPPKPSRTSGGPSLSRSASVSEGTQSSRPQEPPKETFLQRRLRDLALIADPAHADRHLDPEGHRRRVEEEKYERFRQQQAAYLRSIGLSDFDRSIAKFDKIVKEREAREARAAKAAKAEAASASASASASTAASSASTPSHEEGAARQRPASATPGTSRERSPSPPPQRFSEASQRAMAAREGARVATPGVYQGFGAPSGAAAPPPQGPLTRGTERTSMWAAMWGPGKRKPVSGGYAPTGIQVGPKPAFTPNGVIREPLVTIWEKTKEEAAKETLRDDVASPSVSEVTLTADDSGHKVRVSQTVFDASCDKFTTEQLNSPPSPISPATIQVIAAKAAGEPQGILTAADDFSDADMAAAITSPPKRPASPKAMHFGGGATTPLVPTTSSQQDEPLEQQQQQDQDQQAGAASSAATASSWWGFLGRAGFGWSVSASATVGAYDAARDDDKDKEREREEQLDEEPEPMPVPEVEKGQLAHDNDSSGHSSAPSEPSCTAEAPIPPSLNFAPRLFDKTVSPSGTPTKNTTPTQVAISSGPVHDWQSASAALPPWAPGATQTTTPELRRVPIGSPHQEVLQEIAAEGHWLSPNRIRSDGQDARSPFNVESGVRPPETMNAFKLEAGEGDIDEAGERSPPEAQYFDAQSNAGNEPPTVDLSVSSPRPLANPPPSAVTADFYSVVSEEAGSPSEGRDRSLSPAKTKCCLKPPLPSRKGGGGAHDAPDGPVAPPVTPIPATTPTSAPIRQGPGQDTKAGGRGILRLFRRRPSKVGADDPAAANRKGGRRGREKERGGDGVASRHRRRSSSPIRFGGWKRGKGKEARGLLAGAEGGGPDDTTSRKVTSD
ncbi:unnamed protein product [Vitrella brassicaformis CCMP3155]|uniref:EF-hand domain-containing protein n=2 Tax=Vitrella brassicaformis TaxID=1169539 RepID=A0A0G4EWV5_VITBC|nr:unnamed protein product [Vitrella brassicaformis CCMP3155]|eukprot:CEM02559.1 unnamed protein product [Vitrella brassicaformis CCMP3155]